MSHGRGTRGRKEESLGGLLLGRKGFRLGRLLGKGSFSWVYLVERSADHQMYACKISQNVKILEQEAQIMAELHHSLFPAYSVFWKEAGLGLLVIEYVPGCSLEELLHRRRQFTVEQTIRVGMALAEGLRYLHERPERLLFRDVKPSNIMIRQDGSVKLIDLGCVCSMEGQHDSRAGSLGYAAPEQLSGKGELTAACDVYGLGRTMEGMLGADVSRRTRISAALNKKGFPGEKVVLLRRYIGVKTMTERRKIKRLRAIVQACTKMEAADRISDMAQVGFALRELWGESDNTERIYSADRHNLW